MPTYEYLCEKCGLEFEKFQSMNDSALTVCPKELCGLKKWGRGRVKNVSAGAGLLFKGSGFYITDYRSEGYKAAAKKEAGGDSGSGSGDGAAAAAKTAASGSEKKAGKTESKPAAKAGKSSGK